MVKLHIHWVRANKKDLATIYLRKDMPLDGGKNLLRVGFVNLFI
ncbi:hypothetical protein SAMN04488130_11538 [Flavobacterium urumqiense]|uniref:Uncharacterized protein n=1 Tax=Flavobacterium urumqiense TaxID=935224 RepID=A0A1H6ADF2_9FLAO|nr:hypothetical protein SAMN04488130_11538 [Flavobacterium urumqiense]